MKHKGIIEEIAWCQRFTTGYQLRLAGTKLIINEYGQHLLRLAREAKAAY